MGPHSLLTTEKIPVTQAVWQVMEILMNAWIVVAMFSVSFAWPLVIWQLFEVAMNSWILFTMFKVGFKPIRPGKTKN